MAYRIDITKEFRFDAAHWLDNVPEDHRYRRVHGHSFRVAVTLGGVPDPTTGWITDLAEVETVLAGLRDALDHQTLNQIPGLEQPTLEVIGRWIFERVAKQLPAVSVVTLYRDSVGEACSVRREGA